MADWTDVAAAEELIEGEPLVVEAGDCVLVVMSHRGQVSCLEDVCTHDGGPLSEGCFDGGTLACPRHGAKFDVQTGEALTMPATQPIEIVAGLNIPIPFNLTLEKASVPQADDIVAAAKRTLEHA